MVNIRTNILLIAFIVTLIFGCSPAKKLERFQKRYPNYLEKVTDTLIFTDTIRDTIYGSRHDTSFNKSRLKDTVVIENGIVKTIIYEHRDTIFVQNEVDTLYIEKVIEKKIPYPVYNVELKEDYKPLFLIGALILLGIVILLIIRRIKKPP